MKIAIIASTSFEIDPLLQHLDAQGHKASFFHYEYKGHEIYPLVTGIGAIKTAFALARFNEITTLDLAINAGVAGSYNRDLPLGTVVHVTSDRFADLGVEEADGSFTDVYDLELEAKNKYPYTDGALINDGLKYSFDIKKVKALTVNKVNGTQTSIDLIQSKYKADIETMEGAGFHYACMNMDIQHVQLRALSNYVEPRNRAGWQVELAIDKLNQTIIELLNNIEKPTERNKALDWL